MKFLGKCNLWYYNFTFPSGSIIFEIILGLWCGFFPKTSIITCQTSDLSFYSNNNNRRFVIPVCNIQPQAIK